MYVHTTATTATASWRNQELTLQLCKLSFKLTQVIRRGLILLSTSHFGLHKRTHIRLDVVFHCRIGVYGLFASPRFPNQRNKACVSTRYGRANRMDVLWSFPLHSWLYDSGWVETKGTKRVDKSLKELVGCCDDAPMWDQINHGNWHHPGFTFPHSRQQLWSPIPTPIGDHSLIIHHHHHLNFFHDQSIFTKSLHRSSITVCSNDF